MSKTIFRHRARLAAVVMVSFMVVVAAFLLSRASQPTRRAEEYMVASIAPLADIVREVAGQRFQVRTLLPSGASPHTFEPTPAEMMLLSKARAFFRIGLSLELWADKLVSAAQSKSLRVVTVSTGVEVMKTDDEDHHHHDHAGAGEAEIEANPHIWLDPLLVIRITDNICNGLVAVDPDHRAEYERNARAYVERLKTLDAQYRRALAEVPSRRVVVFHNAYAYLARRYHVEIVGVIEESPGKEPSAQHVAALIERIRAHNARAVLVEPQFNPRLGETIAQEAGVMVVTVDPLGTPAQPETMTYIGLMESNLRQLVSALGGGGR